MIKRIEILFITIIITGVLFISGCGRVAVPEYSSSDVMLEAFDEYCMTYNISNAEVRLVDGTGETLWDARYGESEGDRLFAVASITKMFTAAVIFNLDEESLLSLDDCIDSYLPDGIVDGIAVIDGIDYSHEITVRELLSHTSGIADYFSENSDEYISIRSESYYKNDVLYDFDLALDMTRQLEAHFEPGENRKRTDHSRQCDNLHISVEYALFGRYYTQMQFFHHAIFLFFCCLFQQFLTFLYCLLNGSDIQESLFGKIIHFSFQNHLESLDGVFNTHHHTRNACKLFSHGKRL